MKNLIREWGVPAGLLAAWGIAAAWTLSSLVSARAAHLPIANAPAVIITFDRPAS